VEIHFGDPTKWCGLSHKKVADRDPSSKSVTPLNSHHIQQGKKTGLFWRSPGPELNTDQQLLPAAIRSQEMLSRKQKSYLRSCVCPNLSHACWRHLCLRSTGALLSAQRWHCRFPAGSLNNLASEKYSNSGVCKSPDKR